MAVSRLSAFVGQQLTLGIRFRLDRSGTLFDPSSISKVEIIDSATSVVLQTITGSNIVHLSTGVYQVTTDASWNTQARTVRDRWYYSPAIGAIEVTAEESTTIFAASGSANNMVTPDDIRNKFLKGMKLVDEFGESLTDDTIQKFIDASLSTVERELRVDIKKRVVAPNPGPNDVYDVAEAPYDYDVNDYLKWGFLQLYRRPVISVDRIQFIYPTGQKILEVPTSWVKLKPKHGQINLVPTAGTLSQIIVGQGGIYLPMLSAGYFGDLPNMIWINYTTGMEVIPDDIWMAIGKATCITILEIMSDAILQGISNNSISADGLNLSLSRTASPNALLFQARIDAYSKWLENFYSDGFNKYHGFSFTII